MKELTLHFRSTMAGDFWSLRRVEDGHVEAVGFDTEDEARDWADQNGWEIR